MNCLRAAGHDEDGRGKAKLSSSHLDSLGESLHSRQSMESQETWRRIRLQQLLFRSVVQNDLVMVIKCLKHGADLGEEYTPHFQTVLHEAARRGYLKMTELLLRAGAKPNVVDEKSFLPLHYACQEGHVNTVKCLLIYGSMVTIENEYGDAPIHTATRYGHLDLLPLLLSIDPRRDFGREKVPEKYERQLHIDLQNANGDTCLHIAAALDRKNIVKRLLQWGADSTLVNMQDLTALQVALAKQKSGMIKLLTNPPQAVSFEKHAERKDKHQKTFEGLQRYNDEIARHKLEHEGLPKAFSSDNISQASRNPSLFQSMRPIPRATPPPGSLSQSSSDYPDYHRQQQQPQQQQQQQQLHRDPVRNEVHPAVRPLASAVRVGQKVFPTPTKLVELEPQPNNTQHYNGQQNFQPALAKTPSVAFTDSLDPLTNGTTPGQSIAATNAQTMGDRINFLEDANMSQNVDHKIDALSLEVDQKLQSLRNQYADLEKREDQAMKKSMKQKEKKSSQQGQRRERQEIRVTYEDSGSIWINGQLPSGLPASSARKSSSSSTSGQNRMQPKSRHMSETIQYAKVEKPPRQVQVEVLQAEEKGTKEPIGATTQWRVIAPKYTEDLGHDDGIGSDSSQSVVQNDQDRKLSQTYYVPPPPRMPQKEGQEIRKDSLLEENPDFLEDDITDGQVVSFKDGKRVINEAPKIKDMYGGRVGRVSPKIRDLQDQLRKSQYRQIYYGLYDEDS